MLFDGTDYPEAGRAIAKLITASGFSPVGRNPRCLDVVQQRCRRQPEQMAEINRLVESRQLKVRAATALPFAEVKKAHQLSADGHADGKIILRP